MSKRKQKPLIALGTALIASILYFGQGYIENWLPAGGDPNSEVTAQQADAAMTAHFIDVGQADAIILQSDGHSVLVDAGNRADEEALETYIDQLGIEQFELVVGTHSHEDHIGSMASVINKYEIDAFLMPNEKNDTKTYQRMLEALKEKAVPITLAQLGQQFTVGQMTLTVLAPIGKDYDDRNNYSVVLMVEAGGERLLLTGDAETQSEHEMVAKWSALLKADVLKVGHHGSGTSTTAQFLKFVSPKKAVISVGEGNSYGHPDDLILNRLKQYGVKQVLRTDKEGTVVLYLGHKN